VVLEKGGSQGYRLEQFCCFRCETVHRRVAYPGDERSGPEATLCNVCWEEDLVERRCARYRAGPDRRG